MYQVSARIKLEGLEPQVARALRQALLVEAANPPDPHRGRVVMKIEEHSIEILIEARDLSAARTLINAYLGLAATTLEAVRAVGGGLHGSKASPGNRE